MLQLHPVAVLLFLSGPLAAQADDFPVVFDSESERHLRPMAADLAASGMAVPEGFRVDVFASEPDVQNPIAMAWDTRGRLWIAENFTYADRTQRFDLSLRDRVLIFADTDHDGRADQRTVFTDAVQMLTSVEVGRGGVWLMCPPQLLFIPDADGDDVPDGPAKVVLDGFTVAQDNYHNFANGLRWGPDGWLYGRSGHSCPGRLGLPGTPDAERVPIDGGIWRFHPERQVVEVLCHGTVNPWGHDWDRHGELFFINTVIGHVWHCIPGSHFRESFGESQNPAVYDRMDTIADHYHWDRAGGGPKGEDGDASAFGGGHAHIGMMICLHPQWPEVYRNRLFTLNMHGRRANVERLERSGAGYVARHEPDFLIAADPFFRAIDLNIGPDGSLFVIDWSDTGECHEHNGIHRTSGRIFRISHPDVTAEMPLTKPWCAEGNGPLQTLWRNYRDGTATPDDLYPLLRHDDEHLRVWAIRLLTDFWPLDTITGPLPKSVYPDDSVALSEFRRMADDDPSGLVQLGLASTLQRLAPHHRADIALPLLRRKEFADDRDLPRLVWYGLIPLGESDPDALAALASECRWPDTLRWMTRFLATHVETSPEPLNRLLSAAADFDSARQDSIVAGLQEAWVGWRTASRPASWERFTAAGVSARHPDRIRDLEVLFGDGRALDAVRRVVMNNRVELQQRAQALQTLIAAEPDDLRDICESLLSVRVLNAVAARGLATFNDPVIGRDLARSYRRFHPDDRRGLIEILVSRPAFARELLNEIERKGAIAASDVTPFDARQIAGFGDDELTARLESVWGRFRETPADRLQMISDLRAELTDERLARADLSAGRQLFRRSCAQCHRLYGDGSNVAPDLTGSQRQNLDYLLQNIVDPSAVVGSNYRMTVIVTHGGQVLNGLVVSMAGETIVLQTPAEQRVIHVADIAELRETDRSSMPDGLFSQLNPDEIRDLIAYLMHPVQVSLSASAE